MNLLAELRQALRSLRQRPIFFLSAAGILALGMGAALALFTILDSVRIRPLPVAEADSLVVMVGEPIAQEHIVLMPHVSLAWPLFDGHRRENPVFESLCIFEGRNVFLGDKATGALQPAAFVSGNYFQTLGLKPAAGRFFVTSEESQAVPSVVLARGTWMRHFGSDPLIIGREILVDGRSCRVAAVGPRDFSGLVPDRPEALWITIGALTRYDVPGKPTFQSGLNPGGMEFNVVGRLKPGLTRAQAQKLTHTCAVRLAETHRELRQDFRTVISPLSRIQGVSLETFLPHPNLLFTSLALCLLLACLVVANLQLAHQERQRKEHATRLALGESPLHLARRVFLEHLWLTVMGSLGGWFLARLAIQALPRLDPRTHFALLDIPVLRWPVLAFMGILATLLALATTLLPMLQLLRQRPMDVMKEGTVSTARSGLKGALVVLQVALCLSLVGPIAGAVQTLRKTLTEQTSLGLENVEARFQIPPEHQAQTPALVRQLLEGARTLPGSLDAATGGPSGTASMGTDGVAKMNMWVTDGYFRTRSLDFVEGRDFTANGGKEIVIGQKIAHSLSPGKSALGLMLDDHQIIGVVKDEPLPFPFPAGLAYTQISADQLQYAYPLYVRSSGKAVSLIPAVRELIERVIPGALDLRIETHAQAVSRELAAPVMAVTLLGFLGGLALLLAILGVYSMLTFLAAQRTREVGLRTALGARPVQIASLFLRQGTRLVLAGSLLGALGAVGVYRLMQKLLFGLSSARSADYALGFGLLLLASLVASLIPALRASRVQPALALRSE